VFYSAGALAIGQRVQDPGLGIEAANRRIDALGIKNLRR